MYSDWQRFTEHYDHDEGDSKLAHKDVTSYLGLKRLFSIVGELEGQINTHLTWFPLSPTMLFLFSSLSTRNVFSISEHTLCSLCRCPPSLPILFHSQAQCRARWLIRQGEICELLPVYRSPWNLFQAPRASPYPPPRPVLICSSQVSHAWLWWTEGISGSAHWGVSLSTSLTASEKQRFRHRGTFSWFGFIHTCLHPSSESPQVTSTKNK